MFAAKLLAALPLLAAALAQDLYGGRRLYQSSFIKGEVGVHPNHYFQVKLAPRKYDGWFYLQNDLHCAPGKLLGINGTEAYKYLYVGVDNALGYVYIRRAKGDPLKEEIPLTVFADCQPTRRAGVAESAPLHSLDEGAPAEVLRLALEADAKAAAVVHHLREALWADSRPIY